ncbi:MAG: UDP-N-acetylglucosamine--N-acetylmuramyl-(pentapeptide) pyrophosphoryl-undecaprenol N-acetylglucosamine transferase [Bacillota bacterium]
MATIVLCGGGTAGHIMPNIALLPELHKHFDKIAYIGGDGMETKLIPQYNLPFYKTSVVKLNRTHLMTNFAIPFALKGAIAEAKDILQMLDADIIFSKGGYAALPTTFAGKKLGIPVITHESDYSMGVANKLINMFSTATLTSFPETTGGECLGTPIRESITTGSAIKAQDKYPMLQNKPYILIFGGSLGAQFINELVDKNISKLTAQYNIIHISGSGEELRTPSYIHLPFTKDIGDLMALADLVIMRGGANSLAEVTALGKRAICIPLPKGASRGDQVENAKSYAKRNLITVLPQDITDINILMGTMASLLLAPPPKPTGSGSNKKIVARIMDIMAMHRKK